MGLTRRLFSIPTWDVPEPPLEAAKSDLASGAARTGIRSPWAGDLAPIVIGDLFGTEVTIVSRSMAMRVPAVQRAAEVLTSSVAQCPLVLLDGTPPGGVPTPSAEQPKWMQATDADLHPGYRLAFTVDDMAFYGWAVWQFVRARGNGVITQANYLRRDRWAFAQDEHGNSGISIDGNPELENPLDYVLFKSPVDGLCNAGRDTIDGALALERAWRRVMRNPMPAVGLKPNTEDERTDAEKDELTASWRKGANDPDGAVMYVPWDIDVLTWDTARDLFEQGRNAVAVDVARLIGIPAVSIDAGPVQTSLTYANTNVANGLTLPIYGIAPYARVIEWSLSMDTITPPGTRVAVDMTELLADSATISRVGPNTAD